MLLDGPAALCGRYLVCYQVRWVLVSASLQCARSPSFLLLCIWDFAQIRADSWT
jgi:hypothetical protein